MVLVHVDDELVRGGQQQLGEIVMLLELQGPATHTHTRTTLMIGAITIDGGL